MIRTVALAALGLAASASAQPAPAPAGARLKALAEAAWTWQQQDYGRVRENGRWTENGPHLPHVDAASQARRLAYWQRTLTALAEIPADRLSDEERIDAAVLRTLLEQQADEVRFKTYEAPLNSDTVFWTDYVPRSLQTAEQVRRYLSRIGDLPAHFDEQIANMRAGLKRGYSVPRVTLAGRDKSIEPYLAAGEANPFWAPLKALPASIPADEQAPLKAEAARAIAASVVPSYARLLAFIRDEYLPRTRTTLAAEKLPDGVAFYRAQIRDHTTLDLMPEQIHAIGLAEVARIQADMDQVKARSGFTGSMVEFFAFLRTDPRFYARTPGELLGLASYTVKRVDGQLADMFGMLPRRRFTIRAVAPEIAPFYTSGRGGTEACWFNTYDLPSRPLYLIPSLALHECNPGHSYQGAIVLEQTWRPEFRRETYFSGYGEGWALYTEWLGTQMGIYDTPYEDFGRLSYEMWRAARLVIDTGIHHYGWSRERAVAYLRDHAALSDREIGTEVDRYISWPGQALAYKLGEMLIRRKRAEAEGKLGTVFDQKAFHQTILALGSVPLPVLEQALDRFIAGGGKPPPKAMLEGG